MTGSEIVTLIFTLSSIKLYVLLDVYISLLVNAEVKILFKWYLVETLDSSPFYVKSVIHIAVFVGCIVLANIISLVAVENDSEPSTTAS